MGYVYKKNTVLAIEKEITEGTYVEPIDGESFIKIKADFEITPTREALERDILGLGLDGEFSRLGMKTVEASVPTELTASLTVGGEPQYGKLLESGLGGKRSSVTVVSKAGVNANNTVEIADADIAKFKVGDSVKLIIAGAHHFSPITAVDSTASAAKITLLIPHTAIIPSGVSIEAFTTYYGTDGSTNPSLSLTKYLQSAIKHTAIGCMVNNIEVTDLTTGKVPGLNFGLSGGDFDHVVEAPEFAPVYTDALPPIALKACVYMSGTEIFVNNIGLQVANELGPIQNTCNGLVSNRITGRTITGSFDPYMPDDSVANFTLWNAEGTFSLFLHLQNPTAVAGEYKEAICIYIPTCKFTNLSESDLNGVMQDALEFEAKNGNESPIFITYI